MDLQRLPIRKLLHVPGHWRTPAAGLAGVALAAAACGGTAPSSAVGLTPPASPPTSTAATPTTTVSLANISALGRQILVGKGGRTLYLFEKDSAGKSACSNSCAAVWPPVLTHGAPRVGAGVSASLLATTTRGDGSSQLTYRGHPLYYYVSDSRTGQAAGQGLNQFGGLWYAVSASGNAITTGGRPAGAASTPSGGGYGY